MIEQDKTGNHRAAATACAPSKPRDGPDGHSQEKKRKHKVPTSDARASDAPTSKA